MNVPGIPEIRIYRLWTDGTHPVSVWLPVDYAQRYKRMTKDRGLTVERFMIEVIKRSLLDGWS